MSAHSWIAPSAMLRDTIEALHGRSIISDRWPVIFFQDDNSPRQITMNKFIQKNLREHLPQLLLLLLLGFAGVVPALAQTAAKPQTKPAQTGGSDVHARVTET